MSFFENENNKMDSMKKRKAQEFDDFIKSEMKAHEIKKVSIR